MIFQSYRPISNLNFISKVLEKVIYSRLSAHLESFPALSKFQSAYRKFHSTETALLHIHNDLLLAMNKKQVSALVLLDLSAAFDTIDHNILLNRLRSTFGISDTVFSLLSSYLCSRSQSVAVDHEFSSSLPLLRGVPQGSVLGPLLFSLYTTPLSHILADSSIQFHFYADDTQLYVSFSSADSSQSLSKLSSLWILFILGSVPTVLLLILPKLSISWFATTYSVPRSLILQYTFKRLRSLQQIQCATWELFLTLS